MLSITDTSDMLPKIALGLIIALSSASANSQSVDKPLYMGKAATGENVWYYGGRAQCGDLPKTNTCWNSPMIKYRLGSEVFNTVLDCQKMTFKEARSISNGNVYRDIQPTSTATKRMVDIACNAK